MYTINEVKTEVNRRIFAANEYGVKCHSETKLEIILNSNIQNFYCTFLTSDANNPENIERRQPIPVRMKSGATVCKYDTGNKE